MNAQTRRWAYFALSGFLVFWGFLLVFENAFFSAGFFGVPTPWWALWVGNIPNPQLSLTVLDTVAVGAVVLLFLVVRPPSPAHHRRLHSSRGSGAVAAILLVVGLVLLIVLLSQIGLNLSTIEHSVARFFGLGG